MRHIKIITSRKRTHNILTLPISNSTNRPNMMNICHLPNYKRILFHRFTFRPYSSACTTSKRNLMNGRQIQINPCPFRNLIRSLFKSTISIRRSKTQVTFSILQKASSLRISKESRNKLILLSLTLLSFQHFNILPFTNYGHTRRNNNNNVTLTNRFLRSFFPYTKEKNNYTRQRRTQKTRYIFRMGYFVGFIRYSSIPFKKQDIQDVL